VIFELTVAGREDTPVDVVEVTIHR